MARSLAHAGAICIYPPLDAFELHRNLDCPQLFPYRDDMDWGEFRGIDVGDDAFSAWGQTRFSVNELAALMIRDPTTVKRQLDRLVEHKFVERNASSDDARIVMIGLTRLGEKKLATVLPLLDDLRKATLKGVSKSELAATQSVLRTMQKNLTKHLGS